MGYLNENLCISFLIEGNKMLKPMLKPKKEFVIKKTIKIIGTFNLFFLLRVLDQFWFGY